MISQLIVSGLSIGGLYAIVGLSFSIIYSVTRVFHFAHAVTFATAAYMSWVAVRYFEWPLWSAAIAALAAAAVVGLSSEVLVYAPMRRRGGSAKTIMIASLGLFIVGQNALQIAFGPSAVTYYPTKVSSPIFIGFAAISARDIVTVCAALVLAVVVHVALKARAGRALRAVVDSVSVSRIVGINVERTYLFAFLLGSLIVVPGAMIMVAKEGATPWMGLGVLFPMIAATIVGGIGSLRGATVAGFGIGLTQSLLGSVLGFQWQTAITFAILIGFFLYRPQGLFGQSARSKVRV